MKNLTNVVLVVLLLFGVTQMAHAQAKSATRDSVITDTIQNAVKGKKNSKVPASMLKKMAKDTVKKTVYDKLFENKTVETHKSNFITLHRVGSMLYFEMPKKYLGREMLLSSAPVGGSNGLFSSIGYKTTSHVKFVLEDSTLFLKEVNANTLCDPSNPKLAASVKEQSLDAILGSMKIAAWSNDKESLVFEMNKYFMYHNSEMPLFDPSYSIFKVAAQPKTGVNPSLVEMKAFDDNLTVKTQLAYSVELKYMGVYLYYKGDVTIVAARSLMLLPEEKMKFRISDPRVGVFLTQKELVTTQADGIIPFSVAHRWKLEPKDEKAYKQGKLVEPKKSIVFYVDDQFPAEWKEPVKKGVLRWNKAFEKIGFKNVVEVRDFPKNDPEFDPDNLKYSCVRYIPIGVANAMGPSYVDPTTGEIISASVLLYHDVIKVINSWRFVQTAQVDPRVRSMKMSKEIMDESLEYVVAHEVGHTLGFMHNMAGSASIPVDSLRSAKFTQLNGTTSSIMDYARFNYVAQPGDKGVKLTPPDLGVYDDYLVKWNYQYFPDAKNVLAERKELQKLVDTKVGDPRFRYGRQQIGSRYDPSAIEEDLGDDPMKAGDYGIKNLQYILTNMNSWIKGDDENEYSREIYDQVMNQYYRYLRNVMYSIGGVYLTDVNEGTKGEERVVAVPREIQKASLKWLLNHFRNAGWLQENPISDKMGLGLSAMVRVQAAVTTSLGRIYQNILLSSHVAKDPYTIEEYYGDLYEDVFEQAFGRGKLTAGDKLLQASLVKSFCLRFDPKVELSLFGLTSGVDAFAPTLDDIIAYGLDETGMTAKFEKDLRRIGSEPKVDKMHREMSQPILTSIGYNWQRQVSVNSIDNSEQVIHRLGTQIQKLLSEKIATIQDANDKAHYEALLYLLNRRLNEGIR